MGFQKISRISIWIGIWVPRVLSGVLPRTITHAQIKRLSRTRFLATDPIKGEKFFFNAGQITDFCSTDAELRQHKVPIAFPSGYHDFAEIFNAYIEDNPIHFATYDAKAKAFDSNGDPVTIKDFYITEDDSSTKPRNNKSARGLQGQPKGKKRPASKPLEPTSSSSSTNAFTPLVVEPEPKRLTPKRAKVVKNLLWHAAETLHKQQQHFETAKAARLQRKNYTVVLAAARACSSTT